ncbi:MAG: DUF2066 domain-containing protein [Gammaproteobacteria bacterium]|nr:DUF2066 domain-containing protein [Gammaproteobacteria bacterium]
MRTPLTAGVAFIASFMALFLAGAAQAARVDNLYTALVPVEDRSAEVREEAIGAALAAVLVRVAGSRGAARSPELEPLLDNAASYVQVFRYEAGSDGLYLSVTFDGAALGQAVAGAGVAVWGRERPEVIIWLAIDYGGGQRVLLSSDSDGSVANAIVKAAEARGLPIKFPLMDAQDRQNISFADVWGGFNQTVESASERYQADAILVGRARRRAGRRLGVDWKLYYASAVMASEGGITEGIENAADFFARKFVVGGETSQTDQVQIEIVGIASVADFARVLTHLENLSVVDDVQISTVNGNSFVFDLHLLGSVDKLRGAISLGDVLLESAPPPADVPGQVLRFRTRP